MLEPGGTKDNLFPPFYCTNLIHKTRKNTAKGGTKEQLNAVSSSSNSHVKKKKKKKHSELDRRVCLPK